MAANPESIGQDIDSVQHKDLLQIHHAVDEDPFDCPGSQRWRYCIDPGQSFGVIIVFH
jgi:hypothetical protein